MESKCIGENSEFASYHPLVNLLYFVFVIGITMFSLSPYFLAVTLLFSWLYSILLKGKKGIKMNLAMGISILVIMTVVNLFFNNNGETVLLYINTNRITAESIGYGIAGGIMLLSVVVWFSCFNVIMSSDKLIYLFGKAAPVLGLTLSMIFRFIPLLQSRFAEISIGQKCMGRGHDQGSLIKRARQFTKEISILIAWSLEASIESADSMEARGYGLRGRTSFQLFKFTRRDGVLAVLFAATGMIVAAAVASGATNMYFYPKIVIPPMNVQTAGALICYCILSAAPIIIDITGELRWKRSDLIM